MPQLSLCEPDAHGNYWFGRKPDLKHPGGEGAVIFHAGPTPRQPKRGKGYIVSLGGLRGFLFDGGRLRLFRTVKAAFEALEKELAAK